MIGIKQTSESIAMLCKMCSSNSDWFGSYMTSNLPRIVNDANFVVGRIPQSAKILDIGAIPPLFIELLRRNGYQSCSIADLHPEPFAEYFQATRVQVHKVDLLNGAPKEFAGCFDLVCLNEVVEHLAGNLLIALQCAASCVRPDGYLMITTPNLRSIWGLIALLTKSSGLASKPGDSVRAQYDRTSAQFGYYGHIREYTKREVVELVESIGLTFHACEFQANYIYFGRLTRPVAILERLFPAWRLFGKYLFRKTID